MSYEYRDWLLDKAMELMHDNLPEDFIDFIDDDLHNEIVCAFEDYIESKKLFEAEAALYKEAEE